MPRSSAGFLRSTGTAGALVLLVFPGAAAQEAPARLGITGQGIGPVELWMSEADLLDRLGPDAVEQFDAYLGEGMCTPGSIVFPDSDGSIEVAWGDSARSNIVRLSVRAPSVRWRTAAGVAVGMTLPQLEIIAGRPVEFSGFKWDYAGRARWTEGGTEFFVDLAPTDESLHAAVADPLYREIVGDRLIRSDHPLVQRMTIHVRSITLQGVDLPSYEYDCGQPDQGST